MSEKKLYLCFFIILGMMVMFLLFVIDMYLLLFLDIVRDLVVF